MMPRCLSARRDSPVWADRREPLRQNCACETIIEDVVTSGEAGTRPHRLSRRQLQDSLSWGAVSLSTGKQMSGVFTHRLSCSSLPPARLLLSSWDAAGRRTRDLSPIRGNGLRPQGVAIVRKSMRPMAATAKTGESSVNGDFLHRGHLVESPAPIVAFDRAGREALCRGGLNQVALMS